MNRLTLHEFADREALAAALTGHVGTILEQAVAARGESALCVSGGRTPILFFETLSKLDLDWEAVTILLADERWVPETNSRSNAALVREHLLHENAARARFLPFYQSGMSIENGAVAFANRISQLKLEVVVLGMGEDGHTASLFPDAPEINDALAEEALAVLVTRPASQPEARITLSAKKLKSAANVILHIEGQSKRVVLEKAALEGAVKDMPIRKFLGNFQDPLQVYWSP